MKEGQVMKRLWDDNSVGIHDGGVVNDGITNGGDDYWGTNWGNSNSVDVYNGGRVNGGIRNGGRKKREACKLNPFFFFKT